MPVFLLMIIGTFMCLLLSPLAECATSESIKLEHLADKTELKPDIIHAVVNELGVKQPGLSNSGHSDGNFGDTKIANAVLKNEPVISNKHLFDEHFRNMLLKDKAKRKGEIVKTSESKQVKPLAGDTYVIRKNKPTEETVLVNNLKQKANIKKMKRKRRKKQLKRRLNKIKRKNKKNTAKPKPKPMRLRKKYKVLRKNKIGIKRMPGKRLKWILRRKLKGKKQKKTKPVKQLRFLKRRKGKQNKKKPRRKFLRLRFRKRLQKGKKTRGGKTTDKTGKPLKKQARTMKGRRWILRLRKRLQKAIGKNPKSLKPKQIGKDKTGKSTKTRGRKLNNKKAKRKWIRIKLLRMLKRRGKNGKTANNLKNLGNKRLGKWLRLLQNKRKRPGLKVKLSKKKPEKGIRDIELKKKTDKKPTKSSVKLTDTGNAKT